MADELVVVYAFLDTLAANARSSADALEAGSLLIDLTFAGTPEISSAYRDFLDRWDEHRGVLRDGIAGAADAFGVTSEAFQRCEARLVAGLDGG